MVFRVLKQKNFRNFFLSEITYAFGVGMSTVGANWFLMDQTGSIKPVGFMLSLNVIAGFLISPLIGILTDKFKRKVVILWRSEEHTSELQSRGHLVCRLLL